LTFPKEDTLRRPAGTRQFNGARATTVYDKGAGKGGVVVFFGVTGMTVLVGPARRWDAGKAWSSGSDPGIGHRDASRLIWGCWAQGLHHRWAAPITGGGPNSQRKAMRVY